MDGLELGVRDGHLHQNRHILTVDEGNQIRDRTGDAVMMWGDELCEAGAGVPGPNPDLLPAVAAGFVLETALMRQQRAVHGEDGVLVDVVGHPERGFHGADVAYDRQRVRLVALFDLGQSELLRRGRQLLDLRARRRLCA